MPNKSQILRDLTENQEAAVTTTEGRIRVVAGAGSGKTRTLVHRYVYLRTILGVPQSDILCMTFTNKAAQEMKTRIAQMTPGGAVGDFVTTIHGFCVKFLRKEIFRLGYPENFLIFDEEDMKGLVKEVLEENGIDRRKGTVGNHMEELGAFKATTPYISRFIDPESSETDGTAPLLGKMILRQKRYFALDFDDLLNFTLHILNNFQEVRTAWQNRFQYIMVDEVQDCSYQEWELFTILCGQYGNLFVVGDGDQAIYEWRGAHPELFVNYAPDTDIYLRENFRSRPNIVCLADCIIENNEKRLPRTSTTMRPADKFRTQFHHCQNEQKEAETLAKTLIKEHKSENLSWKDMAILYRATYLSRSIEQTFIREKIPYVIWGGVRFFERKEIKDALAYLRIVAGDDDMAFKRVVNVPSRKIGKKSVAFLEAYAAANGCTLFTALRHNLGKFSPAASQFVELILDSRHSFRNNTIAHILESMLQWSGLMDELRADTEEERLENIQELIKSIRIYDEEHKEEEEGIRLSSYLQDIALYTNADYQKEEDKVKLMTIHQAKGLEFPLVWIYGLNEGILPSHRTIRERGEAGLEEERRLMYVACTRAMDKLYFSDSEGFNVQNSMGKFPSRFIREAHDCDGTLYDIIGRFDPELWKGTDRLIEKLDGPAPLIEASFEEGDTVHHAVFGEGVVKETDPDTGVVTVLFEGFGKRRLDPGCLTRKEEAE